MAENDRSALRDFLASIATIKGDLSNITAPPFLLGSQSTVELPSYWAENPANFVAPAAEPDEEKRALLVLRWFLASLKRQQYAGRDEKEGVKKPLNAFLGELFFAQWKDESGITKLVSEQVSHHPPVTACYLWNDEHGVRADGYACQRITFSGTVNIKQIGHAILHIDAYNEDHLIPLPDVKVQGLLSGTPYPELSGTYHIVHGSGYISEIDFSGKKLLGLGGTKNSVHAALHRAPASTTSHSSSSSSDISKHLNTSKPLYTIDGAWNSAFTIRRSADGEIVESYDTAAHPPTPLETAPLDQQDPWESRRAWRDTCAALDAGQMQGASDAKAKIEEKQRAMRREEGEGGQGAGQGVGGSSSSSSSRRWESVFFASSERDERFERLKAVAPGVIADGDGDAAVAKVGVWRFSREKAEAARKPWHGEATPGY